MKVEAGLLSRLAAQWYGSAPALTSGDSTLSFSELNAGANRIGSGLLGAGLDRGDRVGVLAFNTPEVVEAWLGFEKHNLVRAVLHTPHRAEAHAWTLNHIEAKALVFDTRLTELVESCRDELRPCACSRRSDPKCPTGRSRSASCRRAARPRTRCSTSTRTRRASCSSTSGTTGNPKPWIKTYRSWQAVIAHNLHHFDTFGPGIPPIATDDVNLHFHPIQWASGFQTLYPYLIRGARSVLMDDSEFEAAALLDTITSEGVTATFMPGPLLTPVLDAIEARGGFEHSLRRMVVFFGTPELLERTTKLLGPIWAHGFGSTEQGAVTTRLLPTDLEGHPERIASVGRGASPFFDVAIFDPDGGRLGPDEIGEIGVRSAMSLGGYWGLEDATEQAFFDGDWFRPRDVGYLDADGFLYYADRAGDEIQTDEGVVYPHYVEAELLRHGAVANCGVVGVDDQVVAAVLLKDPGAASDDLVAAILTTVGGDVRRPDRIVFVSELPTVLGGAKVQRAALREQLMAAR